MATERTPSLRILMTNNMMSGRNGAVMVTRDLALGLLRAGHRPTVYTRMMGPVAQELRKHSIPVIERLEELQGEFDIIHGHHLNACVGALARFPETPAIFVCQDFLSWSDVPPKLPSIARYVGVSENLVERMTHENGIAPAQTDLILNGVDLDRFQPGPPPPAKPRRALAFAKNLEHVQPIIDACAARQIHVDIIGAAVGRVIDAPESALPQYDLVFASALSAMEAMACGRPTIVVDGRGLAGFVNEQKYTDWRPHNFGLKVMTRRPTTAGLLAAMDEYDPSQAQKVSARLRSEAGLDAWVNAYVRVYEKAIAEFSLPPPAAAAAAWAKHLEVWAPTLGGEWPWMQERELLVRQRDRAASSIEITPLDRPLAFAHGGGAGEFVVESGFSQFETWGVWSTDHAPSIRVRLPRAASGLKLELAYAAYVPAPDMPIEVSVLGNGAVIDRWTEAGHAGWMGKTRTFALPPELCTGLNVWLTFKTARAAHALLRQPQAGEAPEKRFPGLGLSAMTLRAIA